MTDRPYFYDNSEAMRDMTSSDWTSIAEPDEPLPASWRMGWQANRAQVDTTQDEALADLAHGMWEQEAAAGESYATTRRHEDEQVDR